MGLKENGWEHILQVFEPEPKDFNQSERDSSSRNHDYAPMHIVNVENFQSFLPAGSTS